MHRAINTDPQQAQREFDVHSIGIRTFLNALEADFPDAFTKKRLRNYRISDRALCARARALQRK